MSPNEYQHLAIQTENTPDFLSEEGYPPDGYRKNRERMLHGMMGICTEAGELQDAMKREMFYGKEMDITNVMEECGDLLWYIALTLDAAGFSMETAMEANIAKLRARYPDKFTADDAIQRDLDAERKALESSPTLTARIQQELEKHDGKCLDNDEERQALADALTHLFVGHE